jgi:hypothetical protein
VRLWPRAKARVSLQAWAFVSPSMRMGNDFRMPVHLAVSASFDRLRRSPMSSALATCRGHSAGTTARAVAKETMKRVVRSANVLADRLAALGWVPRYGELRTRPRTEDREVMPQIEETTGAPLPVSLRAFWEVVGGINFVWDYERGAAPDLGVDLPMDEMDPLWVDVPEVVTCLFEEWEERRSGVDPELAGPFSEDLAPDYLHKANISGGAPYGIELPCFGVDPIFVNEARELPFVDNLRLCFRWAGFPRLEGYPDRPDVREFLQVMGNGLELF